MKKGFFIAVFMSLIVIIACKPDAKTDYAEMEKQELAKGIQNDSIFFGIHFGMSSKDFYARCTELNKQKIIKEGAGNMTAQFRIDTPTMKFLANMDFYPKFYQNKIYYMPVQFQYVSWNPVDVKYAPQNLQLDVLQLMEKMYGKGFIKIIDPKKGRVFVKVDGSRRISITMDIERDVLVKIVDLPLARQIEGKEWKDEW